jgi:hypothetical protein
MELKTEPFILGKQEAVGKSRHQKRWSVKRFIASISLPELNASSLHCLNFSAEINILSLPKFVSIALMLSKKLPQRSDEAMIYIDNF